MSGDQGRVKTSRGRGVDGRGRPEEGRVTPVNRCHRTRNLKSCLDLLVPSLWIRDRWVTPESTPIVGGHNALSDIEKSVVTVRKRIVTLTQGREIPDPQPTPVLLVSTLLHSLRTLRLLGSGHPKVSPLGDQDDPLTRSLTTLTPPFLPMSVHSSASALVSSV